MENEPIGLDLYNQTITGGVTMTISGAASDSHHIPCVLIKEVRNERETDGLCGGESP
jgi:hypothetical protein